MDLMSMLQGISFGSVTFEQVLTAIIVLAVCLLVIRVLMRAINRAIIKMKIEPTLHGFIRSLIRVLLYFVAVIIVAGTLGIPVTSLIAILSVAGLAISLAAQNSLANVAGGLMILINKPFVVGDFIETAGVSGIVVNIGLSYTKIRTWDNKIVYAPNNNISGEQITNFTAEQTRRVDISMGVPYKHGVLEVKAALAAAVAAQKEVLAEPEPYITVQSYEDNCIKYTLRAWTHTSDYWQVYFALLEGVKLTFDEHGIDMACNNLNISMPEKA